MDLVALVSRHSVSSSQRDTCYTGVVSWPPRFVFISGRVALDFVHTGGDGWRARWERWLGPADLADWLRACPKLEVDAAVDEEDLERARALREAIWEAAQALLAGRSVPRAHQRTIEQTAALPDLVPVLRRGQRVWRADSTGSEALSTVARDAIELFGGVARARLRRCQNPRCFLMFVDESRPGRRAWCTMRRCGNLNKLSRYRSKAAAPPKRLKAKTPSERKAR
jgi:predicted RNA-binding Zn ribbon-like protein